MSAEASKRWAQKNAEKLRAYRKRYYEANKAELLVKQLEYNRLRLAGDPDVVRAQRRERLQSWRDTNREHVREWDRQYRESNKETINSNRRMWYDAAVERYRLTQQSWARNLRLEMIAAYGGHCMCCGETAEPFLALDHVNGDGKAHRLSLAKSGGRGGRSRDVYRDLKRRGWPQDGYRLLCVNCNFATRYGQECPHVVRLKQLVNCLDTELSTAGS